MFIISYDKRTQYIHLAYIYIYISYVIGFIYIINTQLKPYRLEGDIAV